MSGSTLGTGPEVVARHPSPAAVLTPHASCTPHAACTPQSCLAESAKFTEKLVAGEGSFTAVRKHHAQARGMIEKSLQEKGHKKDVFARAATAADKAGKA